MKVLICPNCGSNQIEQKLVSQETTSMHQKLDSSLPGNAYWIQGNHEIVYAIPTYNCWTCDEEWQKEQDGK